MDEIKKQLNDVIKAAAQCGASGSRYVIDIMHDSNIEHLQKLKQKLLTQIEAYAGDD